MSHEAAEQKPEPIVLLVNRSLPYNCVGKLTGLSGVEYGHSIYEEAHAAHVCRLSLDQWRACKQDVARGFTRRWSQWEVDFETPRAVAGDEDIVARVRAADPDQLDAIVSGLGPLALAIHERGKELRGAVPPVKAPSEFTESTSPTAPHAPTATGPHTAESLAKIVNYRVLLKVAREAKVEDPDQFDNTAALREAILAQQFQAA